MLAVLVGIQNTRRFSLGVVLNLERMGLRPQIELAGSFGLRNFAI